jgi:glucokinase-like ROK family protein
MQESTLTTGSSKDLFIKAPIFLTAEEAEIMAPLKKNGQTTRSEIMTLTGWSKAKISQDVNALIRKGYLTEVGDGNSTGGRKPRMLRINNQLGYVVGIDIGATSLDIALANATGVIIDREAEAADVRRAPEKLLSRCRELILKIITAHDIQPEQILGIGVGVPGPVNFDKGVLVAPPLMPGWENYPIGEFFKETFTSAFVVVDNDVNIMALGEQFSGNAAEIDHFILIKIGTGIGSGIMADRKIHRGNDGCAGDIGHICVDKEGPVCRCGNRGCLEAMAAGPAIAEKAMQAVIEGKSDILKRMSENNGGVLTPVHVNAACREGDEVALGIIRESGQMIGEVLASLVNFFNPSHIIIAGGIANCGNHLLIAIKRTVLRRSLPLATSNLTISFSKTGADAGILGAISLVLDYLFIVENETHYSFLKREGDN